MADAILMAGGTGGVTSDDVTASKNQVLKGYKTVTRDSDDEVVEGTFPVTSDADTRQEFWYYNDHNKDSYVTRIPEGAYVRYYNSDGSQGWDPWIRIPRALVKNGINYHPELTVDTVTTCGERGQIPDRGDGAVVSYHQGREDWAGRIWVLFKNGWYHRNPYNDGQGHIHEAFVYVTYEQLKNLFGIDANKMLQGYSIAGVQGNIVPRPNENMTTEIVDIGWTNPKKVGFRFPPGYYPQVGQYQPIVEVNYGDLVSRIGVRADKMLNDTNILGIQGQIKIINTQDGNYRVNKSTAFGIDGWSDVHNPVFWIDFPHGNGFYCRNDNHPHVCIDAVNLGTAGADSVLSGHTASSQYGIKFGGNIQRWICTTGDVISAVNNEGFAWDDSYAGRGRGIVVKIPNKHFIQDANYAFLASPNLYPQNIRAGVNINGVVGTMPDYSTGRTVFNGATFDNVLVSGVATKGFSHNGVYYAYVLQSGYGYGGIYGGGMNLQISTAYPALRSRRIGCVLSQSINVTPFRQIVVYYRSVANIQNSPYVSLEAHIIRASARGQEQIGGQLVDTVDVIRQGNASPAINREGQIVLNVGDINEQIFLSFGAFCNQNNAGDIFSGAVQITRIDFLN